MLTGLLLLLASAPFVAKIVSITWLSMNYAAQSLYKVAQLAAPVGWRTIVDRRRGLDRWWPMGAWPSRATWAWAIGSAAASIGLAMVCVPALAGVLGIEPTTLRANLDARFSMSPLGAIAVVAFLATANAALEELHFRAWLDPELSRRWGDGWGIALSAGAFAAMHLFIFANMPGVSRLALVLVFVALFAMAVVWSWLARRPGGIHAAWLSHALTDAGLLTWGLFWLGYF